LTHQAPYPGTQTVRRAIALLKLFTGERAEWSLADLARTSKLNKTTTYRLLQALESEGMVARGPQGDTYRLGPEAISLGGRALRSNDLRTASHPELQALAERTQETVTLEVLSEGQVLILDEVAGAHVLGNIQLLGTRWPVHATSTGKVLLAHLPDGRRDAILDAGLARYTDRTQVSADALRQELAQVRAQGYAAAVEELEAGFVAVGAPVRNYSGDVIAAISVGGPALRFSSSRIAEVARLVCHTASLISQRLGH
jgi:IclR family transcriptional regulator, acetate operon repressor